MKLKKCDRCVYYRYSGYNGDNACCVKGDLTEECPKFHSSRDEIPSNFKFLCDRLGIPEAERPKQMDVVKRMCAYKDGDDPLISSAVWKYWGDTNQKVLKKLAAPWLSQSFKTLTEATKGLEPCPFCGSEADYIMVDGLTAIKCTGCGAMIACKHRKTVQGKWNRRTK